MVAPVSEVTALLATLESGDEAAMNQLVPLVYQELRLLARRHLAGQRQGHTLQTADLVGEAYLKLVNPQGTGWKNRAHFFAVASHAMRSVLVDYARRRRYAKRGGNALRVSLSEADQISEPRTAEVVAVDEALSRLATLDPRKAQIVADRLTAPVGRYLLERELGSGGMGVVYAAYDPELGRKVAIKLVRPASGGMDLGKARLLREAQAMAQVTHPNVVAIHDVGTVEDQVFIAMEYIEGSTLGEWLAARERSWREITSMFAQAGRGLAAAHAKNIVHRDFKSDNVWVGEDGRARVLDFGLARAMRGAGELPQSAGAPAEGKATRSPRV